MTSDNSAIETESNAPSPAELSEDSSRKRIIPITVLHVAVIAVVVALVMVSASYLLGAVTSAKVDDEPIQLSKYVAGYAVSEPDDNVEAQQSTGPNLVGDEVSDNTMAGTSATQPVEHAGETEAAGAASAEMITPVLQVGSAGLATESEIVDIAEKNVTWDAPQQGRLSAIVVDRNASLYNTPKGDALESVALGTGFTATGRSADGAWIYGMTDSDNRGWLDAEQVSIFNAHQLPILDSVQSADLVDVFKPVPDNGAVVEQIGEESSADDAMNGISATVTLSDSRLNVRSGPAAEYAIVSKAYPDDSFEAVGRSEDGSWIQITLPDSPEAVAWVSSSYVELSGDVNELPLSERVGDSVIVAAAYASNSALKPSVTAGNAPAGLSGKLVIQDGVSATIYLADLATGELRPLTTGYDPDISPDGGTVAFVRSGGDNGLYLIDIDGSDEHRIYNGREEIRGPSWSPDGNELVFSFKSGSYNCRELGLGICYPTNPYLESFPEGSQPLYSLSIVDRNGENYRDLPVLESARAPEWSESGIVYSADKGIEFVPVEPTDAETRRVVGRFDYQDPSVQPGGDRIIFQSREGTHWEVFTVNTDGDGLAPLTRPETALVDQLPSNVAPAWSPDGRHIIYLSSRDENDDTGDWRLWVMDADGANQRPLGFDMPLDYHYDVEQAVSWGL